MSVETRFAREADWVLWRDARLRALQDAPTAFGSTYEREVGFTEQDWRGRLSDSGGTAVLALHAGTAVGVAGGYVDVPGWLHIVSMWVDPAWRGRRIGRKLLERVVARATEQGLRCHLDVTVGNDAARRLYEGYGFVGTGEVAPLNERSPHRCERMTLPATPPGISPH